MIETLGYISEKFLPTIISAIAIILGSIVGGICSWIVTQKATYKTIEEQHRIVSENRKCEELERRNKVCENATIIRLDICTALFQSIRLIKGIEKEEELLTIPIPMNKEYSKAVASLKNDFTLKEMSYIYQLYGIIEKLNSDIHNIDFNSKENYTILKLNYEIFLKKLYGINYRKVVEIDIEKVAYNELYNNSIIKVGYKNILSKLDEFCE